MMEADFTLLRPSLRWWHELLPSHQHRQRGDKHIPARNALAGQLSQLRACDRRP